MQHRVLISAGTLFALPALAGLLIFVAIPFLLAIGHSFTKLQLGSTLYVEFVRLIRFLQLFEDSLAPDTKLIVRVQGNREFSVGPNLPLLPGSG